MKKFLLITLISFLSDVTLAQPSDTLQQIDALFSQWHNATPGGAIAIKRGEKIIYHKAYGLADLEHQVPNTTETIFESGSVAKQFTATAILLLIDQKKISLQDDVRKYVPELPNYGKVITIQHLLNHISGLKDWGSIGGLAGWPRTTRIYTLDLALHIICKQKSLNFEPGSKYSYSNSNYSLLVTIVERVSKTTLDHFTDSAFFKPLHMISTKWRNDFREVIVNRAIAYSGSEGTYRQLMPFENVHGHGGLLTTTNDLLRWNMLLENHELIGNRVAEWRIEQGKLTNGEKISYASGLFIQKVNGYQEISHSGATAGYRAWLAYYPQKKLSVVILSNDASFRSVSSQISEIFLGKESVIENPLPTKFIAMTETDKKSWAGTYKSQEGMDVISLDYKDNHLLSNGNVVSVIHTDTLYFDRFWWIRQKENQIILKNQNGINRYIKVAPPDANIAALQSLQGNYDSEDAEVTYKFTVASNELWLQIDSFPKQKLTPAYQNGFHDDDYVFYEFQRDKKNNVKGLLVSTSRALRVPFTKR